MGNIAIDIRNYYNSNTEDGSLARKYVQGKSNESQLKIVKMFKGVKIRKQDRGNIIAFFRDLSDDIRYPAVLAIILDQPEKDRWRIYEWINEDKELSEYMEDDVWASSTWNNISLDNIEEIAVTKTGIANIIKIRNVIKDMQKKLNEILNLIS